MTEKCRAGRDAIERDRWDRKGLRIKVATCACGASTYLASVTAIVAEGALCEACRSKLAAMDGNAVGE